MTKESLDTYYDELGKTLGEALIEPTRIYVKAFKNVKMRVLELKDALILQEEVSLKMYLECFLKM